MDAIFNPTSPSLPVSYDPCPTAAAEGARGTTSVPSPGPAEVWSLAALGSPLTLENLRLTRVEEAHAAGGPEGCCLTKKEVQQRF